MNDEDKLYRLKQIRKFLNLTLADISDDMCMSHKGIHHVEKVGSKRHKDYEKILHKHMSNFVKLINGEPIKQYYYYDAYKKMTGGTEADFKVYTAAYLFQSINNILGKEIT